MTLVGQTILFSITRNYQQHWSVLCSQQVYLIDLTTASGLGKRKTSRLTQHGTL